MMVRIVLVVGLLLSLFLLAGSMTATWRQEAVPAVEVAEKARPGTVPPERRKLDVHPPVPARLPDLNKGYIFNEARFLADEGAAEGPASTVAETTIDEVTYIGSVISGERRIGIISYEEKSSKPQPRVVRGRPVTGASRAESNYARLAPGETFGGFTVAEVLPDKILFEKNGRKVEKLLDTEKERKPPPPQPQSTRRVPRPGRQTRTVSPRRIEPAARIPGGIGTESGRPVPEPQPPAQTDQNRTPHIIRGVPQPS